MTRDPAPASGPVRNRRWRLVAGALLVLFGFGAGVIASHLGRIARHRDRAEGRSVERGRERVRDEGRRDGDRRGADRERRFREHLREELALTEAQQEQLDAFLVENRAEASAFWDDTYSRYRELRRAFREQIRGILTEAQSARFSELIDRMERHEGREPRDARRESDDEIQGAEPEEQPDPDDDASHPGDRDEEHGEHPSDRDRGEGRELSRP